MADTGFKAIFDEALVRRLGSDLRTAWSPFDAEGLVAELAPLLPALEMKARAHRIAEAVGARLPEDFEAAAEIMVASLGPVPDASSANWADFGIWPLTMVVEQRGLGHLEASLAALHAMTQRFTAEFAIRPFLRAHPEAVLERLELWTEDGSEHVRRLVSEGTRTKLPWGGHLHSFIAQPEPVIALLERLKDDPAEYVRRSVANNLNDLSKDHAGRVVEVCEGWMVGASKDRARLVRHALRTLVKAGDVRALTVLGFAGDAPVEASDFGWSRRVVLGGALELSCVLTVRPEATEAVPVVVDYIVHHQKKGGYTTPKTFKWTTRTLAPGQRVELRKAHAMKAVTTRAYYPGGHRVEVVVNGAVVASGVFELVV